MTTEILRSLIHSGSNIIRNVEFVIFDELHYVNDAERGYVWEEVLILLPSDVKIVMLSATVPNALEFADWVGRIKKRKVFVVSTPKRPVPLCHYLYTGPGGNFKNERFLVVNQEGNFQSSGYYTAVDAKEARNNESETGCGPEGTTTNQCLWEDLVDHLSLDYELPMIVFTLSRDRCDQNAKRLMMSRDLTTKKTKRHIQSFLSRSLQRLEERDRQLPQVVHLERALESGIGVHHSGMLPLLKEIVEMLFQTGHIKVLFTTETFAMGVNMPARTVVFDDIRKFDGVRSRILTPAEYTQMAGRAGRRGLDTTGTVIILCKEDVPHIEGLKHMMLGTPQKLSSQFRLTYGTILSLLSANTVSVEEMMQCSFQDSHKVEKYRKQLQIAEREYLEEFNTPLASHLIPLAKFYDIALAYIEVLKEVMPLLLNQFKFNEEFVAGKVLILSAGPYINQLAVYLKGDGPEQTPYQVLVLNTAEKDTARCISKADDNWYRMLSFSAAYETIVTVENTMDHTILYVAPENVIAVTRTNLEINADMIIQDWKKRQSERFKDAPVGSSCVSAVRELWRVSREARTARRSLSRVSFTKSLETKDEEILHLVYKMKRLRHKVCTLKKVTDIAEFKSKFAIVYERKKAERKRDKYIGLLSFENLTLYEDYQRRLLLLRELNYINGYNRVILKGRFACYTGAYGLIVTELVFHNVFTDMDPAEIAALLSCFVFDAKTRVDTLLTDKLEAGVKAIQQIHQELRAIETKYSVSQFGSRAKRLNFGLVKVVHEWALQKPFADIVGLTDVQEGVIVRCIQQLHELLVHIKDAAVAIGDQKLQAEMTKALTAIRRDILFTASLYTNH